MTFREGSRPQGSPPAHRRPGRVGERAQPHVPSQHPLALIGRPASRSEVPWAPNASRFHSTLPGMERQRWVLLTMESKNGTRFTTWNLLYRCNSLQIYSWLPNRNSNKNFLALH